MTTPRHGKSEALPSAETLTKSTCRALMRGTLGSRAEAKGLFKERLVLEGISRGSIPVKDPSAGPRTRKRVQKPLSRCTHEELGQYLLDLDAL